MPATLERLGITPDRIQHYDQRIPRYTSYPTAPSFTEEFDAAAWQEHLHQTSATDKPLSLYVHIPFCEKHCLFCACNTIITQKREVAADYLDWLEREITLMQRFHRGTGDVIQLHLGGGTPNYLNHEQMARLVKLLSRTFTFSADAERSIEVDPRVATPEDIHRLYSEHGYNRISFGAQDFNPATQEAIGREQTEEITFRNVAAAREAGFASVNLDLIYGLPLQTEESWSRTLDAVARLRPDRIALYNFAYLPGRLPHQRTLDEGQLPEAALKLRMFVEAHNRLTAEGWEFIGMDHYSLKGDSLTVAQREGNLRRNFMGYTTLRGTNILAFGVSSISDYQDAFAQNVKKLTVYQRMIEAGQLPLERGLALTEEDRYRRFVIEEIMCNGVLHQDARPVAGHAPVGELIEEERVQLEPLAEDGLLELDEKALRVTEKGRIFLRNIAVVFDARLRRMQGDKPLFSRAV